MSEAINSDWEWLDQVTGPLDADFEAALEELRPPQERPELGDVFR